MPLHSFRCHNGHIFDKFQPADMLREYAKCPHCALDGKKVFLKAPMVSVFNTYRTVAHDKETGRPMKIGSKAEHEAFLRRNGYEEVGNDKSMAPPSAEELSERKQKWRDAPDAPMVDVEKLKREGWIEEDLV